MGLELASSWEDPLASGYSDMGPSDRAAPWQPRDYQPEDAPSISVLPLELLTTIFHDVAEEAGIPGVISVSHVCSYWRALALGCPTLWSTIVLPAHAGVVTTLLGRSQNAPLEVDFGYWSGRDEVRWEAIRAVVQELPRIRALYIHGPLAPLNGLMAMLDRGAPLLESLSVWAPRATHTEVPLPAMLQDPQTAALRYLQISGYSFNAQVALPRSLRHLELKILHNAGPTLDALFTLLAGLPCLEILHVQQERVPFHPGLGDSRQQVTQPASNCETELALLRTIRLCAQPLYCADVLVHFRLPALSSLTVDCDDAHGMPALAAAAEARLASLADLQTLKIAAFKFGRMRLCAESPRGGRLDVSYMGASDDAPLSAAAPARCSEPWLGVFARMTSVAELHVDGRPNGPPLFLPAVGRCFPQLRLLRLAHTPFLERFASGRGDEVFANALFACLKERCLRGQLLEELRLTDSCYDLGAEEVARLRNVAYSVVWEGEPDVVQGRTVTDVI